MGILAALVDDEIANGTVWVEGGILFIHTAAKQKTSYAAQDFGCAKPDKSTKTPFPEYLRKTAL